jgi:DNA-binding transcriptional MocR family regulator
MIDLAHSIRGDSAVKIAASVEGLVREGRAAQGGRLPTVRRLARGLGVSPGTVAAAYRTLRQRGVIVTGGRRGTLIRAVPRPMAARGARLVARARNLCDGNPDPRLLPRLDAALRRIDVTPVLYGEAPQDVTLTRLVARDLKAEGVRSGEVTFVSGAMDGVERVLRETARPGDRVAVEDPGFGNVVDLVLGQGLVPVPVALDDEGLLPDALARALAQGVRALIVIPRAQNPTGAAFTEARARELRAVLRREPDVLVIEDDHASLVTDAPLNVLHADARRWAHLRSFSKALGPDLRLAALTGDPVTMAAVQDRQVMGERWVSHLLQRIAAALLSDAAVRRGLRRAAATYAERREALIAALGARGLEARGASGYNVWLPVREETPTVQALERAGWAVAAGERFRLSTPPAVRITAATLEPAEARRLAEDLVDALRGEASRAAPS